MTRRPAQARWRLGLLTLGWLGAATGCGGTPSAGAPEVARAGDERFDVSVIEDLSRVRDVFRSGQAVYSSTERGLYVYPTSGPPRPTRLGLAAGLPSEDVLAARLLPDDTLVALTSRGLGSVALRAERERADVPPPPLGTLYDIELTGGLLYACGELGLARLEPGDAGGWRTLSELPTEALGCRALVRGVADTLFVLGEASVTQLAGDELREHRAPAFPEGRPRALVEAETGELFVLLEGPRGARLARWAAGVWWSYDWSSATGGAEALTLVAQAGVPLLVTPDAVFALGSRARGGAALVPTARREGRPLLFRATPSLPRATAPLAQRAELAPAAPLPPAGEDATDEGRDELAEAPPLFAHALPLVARELEGAFASDERVYLAQRGRGLIEIGETRRRLGALDFRDLRPLTLAGDERGGTWLRADDGTLVRVEGGVGRTYPHGRASALVETHAPSGAHAAGEVWVALVGAAGDVLLATPAPTGWIERARLPEGSGVTDVRLGVRSLDGHLWLLAHGARADWPKGYGLVYRDPGGAWSFLDVPLEPRGALPAITRLASVGPLALVAGPGGLARVPASGTAEVLSTRAVTDAERVGSALAWVSEGALFELALDAGPEARARALLLSEESGEALQRVNPSGLALTPTLAAVSGEGGVVLGSLPLEARAALGDARWAPLRGGEPSLFGHDVERSPSGAWLLRRDGALVVLTPRAE